MQNIKIVKKRAMAGHEGDHMRWPIPREMRITARPADGCMLSTDTADNGTTAR
jgi:hypothetical protein